jgi:5,10-methylenetetrahydromethanopterin reductase
MDFGITLPTKADSWKVVKKAEELGFSHAWFYDTALLNAEIFVAMGAAAVKTSRIKLCAGVLTPSNRIAPVAASGLASLNALAPGRIVFGVGTGFTGRRTLGLGPVTLEALEGYTRAIEGLLRGETISYQMEGRINQTRLMTPETGIINIKDSIPTHVSAFGPKGRELTARLGAGWIGAVSTPSGESEALAHMKSMWLQHGRDPESLYSTLVFGGSVLNHGENDDSARVRAQAGPSAAVAFHDLVEREAFGAGLGGHFPFQRQLDAYRKVYKSYTPADARYLSNHRGHLMFVRPEESHISGEVISGLTLTGTPRALAIRIQGMKEAGYSQVAFSIPPGQEEDMLRSWMDVFQLV